MSNEISSTTPIKQGIHVRLREARTRLGIRQDEFSDLVGVSRATQMSYENGTTYPTTNYLARAQAIGINIAYLLFDIDDEEHTNTAEQHDAADKAATFEFEEQDFDFNIQSPAIKFKGLNIRLKEERKKNGHTQLTLATIGQRKRTAQVSYESGKTCPDIEYLANLQSAGIDIQYILNGRLKGRESGDVNWALLREVFEAAQKINSRTTSDNAEIALWELTRKIYEASKSISSGCDREKISM